MSIPYNAKYNTDDVVRLFDAIAPVWKKSAEEANVDPEVLYKTLESIMEEVRKLEKYDEVDKDLQALLAMVTATSWFDEAQVKTIDEWLGEVAEPEDSDWLEHFPEPETEQAVVAGLRARTASVTIDKIAKGITIEYEGGNYGQGKHDGEVRISDEDVRIYDSRYPGKYLISYDELPHSPDDLKWCLQSSNWGYGTEEEWEG
mmetsp:Transcript_75494/g.219298  ORF Transcript_75494/g.219298 Transcript_75494/m.219298 type:complete len:202 (+) Transcript_75494:47-652(+)|eukprot:CAMPEP_0176060418 /NCGR_PEP_ID=MMETSP0120_2-20121206/30114_1 /TAXON_ID=160619 /ORGANISM="Kryptoperidinium foliaceum, Strain CCMP 1326" /LENGTH=201 /DNA_ID=CAMNT_0017393961 /DNA_START=70 /DNA_END=675 /DNA_ORIENTATION=-